MDNDLLTDEEMAVVQGDKERCLAVIGAFGTCDGCSAYCRGISKAQSAKTKAALVAEGWKSPSEVAKARQGWLYEGRMAEREKMKRFIAEARVDERKIAQLEAKATCEHCKFVNGVIEKDMKHAERARIVGLFDAEDEIDGSLSHIVSAYSGIIEGLREKK
jgi:hypothetical protein